MGGWKIFFCNFYKINSSQDFFFLYCKNFGVDGILGMRNDLLEMASHDLSRQNPGGDGKKGTAKHLSYIVTTCVVTFYDDL